MWNFMRILARSFGWPTVATFIGVYCFSILYTAPKTERVWCGLGGTVSFLIKKIYVVVMSYISWTPVTKRVYDFETSIGIIHHEIAIELLNYEMADSAIETIGHGMPAGVIETIGHGMPAGAIETIGREVSAGTIGNIAATVIAAIGLTIYARMMAIKRKQPATIYMLPSIFPLVPGSSMYYGARAFIVGNMQMFGEKSLEAIEISMAIALGIILGMSLPMLGKRKLPQKSKVLVDK